MRYGICSDWIGIAAGIPNVDVPLPRAVAHCAVGSRQVFRRDKSRPQAALGGIQPEGDAMLQSSPSTASSLRRHSRERAHAETANKGLGKNLMMIDTRSSLRSVSAKRTRPPVSRCVFV